MILKKRKENCYWVKGVMRLLLLLFFGSEKSVISKITAFSSIKSLDLFLCVFYVWKKVTKWQTVNFWNSRSYIHCMQMCMEECIKSCCPAGLGERCFSEVKLVQIGEWLLSQAQFIWWNPKYITQRQRLVQFSQSYRV